MSNLYAINSKSNSNVRRIYYPNNMSIYAYGHDQTRMVEILAWFRTYTNQTGMTLVLKHDDNLDGRPLVSFAYVYPYSHV